MDLGIKGRVAFVTGGSRGLGKASALALAREGVDVAICARGEESLRSAESEMRALGVRTHAFACDLCDPDAPAEALRQVEGALGPVDILVNNVGGSLGTSDLLESTEEDFRRVFDINLWCAIRLMKLAVPGMRARGWGRVVNIASIYGREWGGTAPYMAAKASLIAATKHLAITVARDGVCVNSVAPGSILHPGGTWDRFVKQQSEETVRDFIDRNMPLGRFGWPESVGATVAFLASERADLIVGACVNVDGGQSHSLI